MRIAGSPFRHLWIKRITLDREPDRRHMQPQLMLLACLRHEPEQPDTVAFLQQVDFSNRIGFPFHDLLAEPWFTALDSVFDPPMRLHWRFFDVCQGVVFALDQTFGKKAMVRASDVRSDRQEENSGCLRVEPMHWRESINACCLLKKNEKRPLDELPNGSYRHSVWLINDENILVAVNDDGLLGRGRLERNLPAIKDEDAMAIGRVLDERRPVAQCHHASPDSIPPDIGVNPGKPREEVIENGRRRQFKLWQINARHHSFCLS